MHTSNKSITSQVVYCKPMTNNKKYSQGAIIDTIMNISMLVQQHRKQELSCHIFNMRSLGVERKNYIMKNTGSLRVLPNQLSPSSADWPQPRVVQLSFESREALHWIGKTGPSMIDHGISHQNMSNCLHTHVLQNMQSKTCSLYIGTVIWLFNHSLPILGKGGE